MRAFLPSSSLAVAALALCLVSCGGTQGPAKVKPGSPAFFWANAQESVKKGNFAEASDQLDKLTGKDGEFRDRAETLQIVIATGLARGEMEWAGVWDDGSKSARARHLEFLKTGASLRHSVHQRVMRAAEITHKRLKELQATDLALPVTLPVLVTDLPVEAERVMKGVALQPSEQAPALLHLQQRGALQSFAEFTGAGKDIGKARDLLSKGDFRMPKDVFLLALARQYTELTDIYAPKKLDQSGQVTLLCSEADAALALATASADVKAQQKKIAAIRAKVKK
jgi:hypothetical protein